MLRRLLTERDAEAQQGLILPEKTIDKIDVYDF